jgi:hypothetical protein
VLFILIFSRGPFLAIVHLKIKGKILAEREVLSNGKGEGKGDGGIGHRHGHEKAVG